MAETPSVKSEEAYIIRPRPRVRPMTAVVLALAFSILATPLVMIDSLLQRNFELVEGETAPVTVRAPAFGYDTGRTRFDKGAIVVARGETVTYVQKQRALDLRSQQPAGAGAWLAYLLGMFLVGLLYTTQARRTHGGQLLRSQAVTLLFLLMVAFIVKLALLLSPMSILLVPVAAIALIAAMIVDLSFGLMTGVASALLIGLLTPFDAGVLVVLAVQAVASVLMLGQGTRHKKREILLAGTVGGLAAATAYAVFFYLSAHQSPGVELAHPLRSAWLAAAVSGLLAGGVAIVAKPLYQWLLGETTRNKLVELEDLSNKMLRQIAEKSPGTWQHSLAMANMAEIAANAIGANGRLVRVGAYYHDLGKSLQPSYFIENLRPGETSPHDRLQPEVSCDAIFAHVTEGVRLGRKEGLPERVIDFMHMHHGDGLLEYFWAKCQEQGNPKGLTEADFRYPGVRPQTRETAILAICDAVEAASRTLKKPDEYAVRTLVQRIVYGKLHLGQLDESGLSVPDLRKISDSLIETIKHAYHGRIEYPWQRKEREQSESEAKTQTERPRAASELAAQAARASATVPATATQRIIEEPRLDSLDVPRPYWRERTTQKPIEHAPTERVPSQNDMPAAADPPKTSTGETALLTKPKERADTDPEVMDEAQLAAAAAAAVAATQPVGATAAVSDPADAAVDPEPEPEQSARIATQPVDPEPEPEQSARIATQPVDPEPEPEQSARIATQPVDPDPEPEQSARIATQPVDPEPEQSARIATQPVDPEPPREEPFHSQQPAPVSAEELAPVPSTLEAEPSGASSSVQIPAFSQPKVVPTSNRSPSKTQRLTPVPTGRETLEGPGAPSQEARPENTPPAPKRTKRPAEVLADLVAAARERAEAEAEAEITLVRRAPTSRAEPRSGEEGLNALETEEPAHPRKRRRPPPPPGSPARNPRDTVQLLGDEAPDDAVTQVRAVTESESDEALSPGVLVIGPPPATHNVERTNISDKKSKG